MVERRNYKPKKAEVVPVVKFKTKYIEDRKDPLYIPPEFRRTEGPITILTKRQREAYEAGKWRG